MQNKLVGIDRAWGSGKSNLIQILASKLSGSFHFFVYDSWGHQEDLHRRSFLEELTSNLCDNEVIKCNVWEEKLKELLSRKRETVTRTIPRLSDGVIWTVLIAIMTPIAQTLADMVDNDVGKLSVAFFPILVGVFFYLLASLKKCGFLSFRDLYSLYNEDDLRNESHETVFESEPSVRQFRKWMCELSKGLGPKKLVIVFDNMDRLPPDKVRKLWSSIHTFFAENSFDGIWVIVPFDRNHISMAFRNGGDRNGTELSEEFLRKSFSMIFRVPPPVLTDWKKFFEQKYGEAFKGEREEMLIVSKIFGQFAAEITPRSVIAFINEMVSLRLTSQERIPLRYVAVFVLRQHAILENPVDRILDGNFFGSVASPLEGDAELSDSIATVVYGVPIAFASQVALIRKVRDSVVNRDTKRLLRVSDHRSFVDVQSCPTLHEGERRG